MTAYDSDYLFAYGTLAPADGEEAIRDGWVADAVRGVLYDLGPYPALVEMENPNAGWVEGYARTVSFQELESILDPYEGTEAGLFERIRLRTRRGLIVWVYRYCLPIPKNAVGPLTRWQGLTSGPRLVNHSVSGEFPSRIKGSDGTGSVGL